MCHPAKCRTCGKTTWSGCGQHADEVMAQVPRADRCTCTPEQRVTSGLLGWLRRR